MALPALGAIDHVPTLEVGGHVYSNVTVTSRTPTHLFIQHSSGFAGVKIDDLNEAALSQLGYTRVEKNPPAPALNRFKIPIQLGEWRDLTPKFSQTDDQVSVQLKNQTFSFEKHLFKGVLAGLAIAYVIFCHCATLICRKSGLKPGIGCWVPIIQWGLLFRAARLPAWWILLSLLVVTIVPLWMMWSVKICRAQRKGGLTILLMMFPLTTPLAFLYLACANEQQRGFAPIDKVRLTFQDAV